MYPWPSSGFSIANQATAMTSKRDYDTYLSPGRPLPFGQVYATLSRLARDGKAVAGDVEPGAGSRAQALLHHRGGKARSRGVARRADPRRALPPDGPLREGRPVVDARPARRRSTSTSQRAAHLRRMRELTELKLTGSLVDGLLADHGLFHLEADLRWIDLTAARLDVLAGEVRT